LLLLAAISGALPQFAARVFFKRRSNSFSGGLILFAAEQFF